jgi:predicted NBD/HSP70 family sugar kinase
MSPGEMVLDEAIRFGLEKSAGIGVGGRGRTQRGSDNVDPKMRIDWVESFPVKR